MERVVVVGNSGSGKTIFSKRLSELLDVPHLELDSMFHRGGWDQLSNDEFDTEISEFLVRPQWVVDGNYTSRGTRDILWPKADTFVWLDLPKRVIMRRVVMRTSVGSSRERSCGTGCENHGRISTAPTHSATSWSGRGPGSIT